MPAKEGEPASAACLLPTPHGPDAELTQKLAGLESRLDTLQEHIAQLALALHLAEQLAQARRPPLIEYCPSGIYVLISSQEGEVHLEPNARAWFDWLATLSSFRFIGPLGRKTRSSRLQTGKASALLVGLPLCTPSYLQALSWRNGELDSCQPGAHRGQTSV